MPFYDAIAHKRGGGALSREESPLPAPLLIAHVDKNGVQMPWQKTVKKCRIPGFSAWFTAFVFLCSTL